MKKTLKKIGAALLAAAFLAVNLVPAMGAFAADPSGSIEGSITVNKTVVGKEYEIYKIFDLTYQGEDPNKKVSYTIADKWKPFFQTVDGAKYLKDKNNAENPLNPILVKEGKDSKIKYIDITDENIKDFSKDALKFLGKVEAEKTEKATGTTLEFQNLPFGYYLVYPKGASTIINPSQDKTASIVSITSAAPKGEVDVKSTYPTLKKETPTKTADYGEDITYTITGKVPDTTGYETYIYTITDTLSDGLTLNANSVKVTVGTQPLTTGVKKTVEGQKLTLEFTNMKDLQGQVGQEIKVTYTAKLNDQAVIGTKGNTNTAQLTYSNDPKDGKLTTQTPEETVSVYTGSITINKVDGKDKTPLSGAKFILKNAEGKYYKYDGKAVSWVAEEQKPTVVETDKNGAAAFKGLKDGTYWLIETEAPKGYNKLTTEVEMTVKGESQAAADSLVADVKNYTGKKLPGTGGMGAKLFIVIGGGIGLLAAGMYRRSRKMNAGNR